ncbi:MAG: hypothetical protein GY953_07280 [bacterium]|nr:hypothetical protein [bacterium]
MAKHLSNEDLINRLYEVGDGDDAHLRECRHCSARWEQLLARRKAVLAAPELPQEMLAAQRREIYRRLDEGHHVGLWPLRFAPALAALSVVVLGVMLSGPTPEPPVYAVNDSEFYTEIYSMVEGTEPDAIAPIYGLFED